MYLEISARQSGKTTRMIEQVKKEMQEGNHCVIVVPHMSWGDNIEKLLGGTTRYSICTMGSLVRRVQQLAEARNELPLRAFYDEFDQWEGVPVDETGYYCTTPYKGRSPLHMDKYRKGEVKDSMLELIDLNGGVHLNYSMLPHTSIRDMVNCVPKTRLLAELYGTFSYDLCADDNEIND